MNDVLVYIMIDRAQRQRQQGMQAASSGPSPQILNFQNDWNFIIWKNILKI